MERSKNQGDDESELLNKEFLKGKDLSNQTEYQRPNVMEGFNDREHDIIFMQIDCDYYTRKDGMFKFN